VPIVVSAPLAAMKVGNLDDRGSSPATEERPRSLTSERQKRYFRNKKAKRQHLEETVKTVRVDLEEARAEKFRLTLLEKVQLKISSYLHQTVSSLESVVGPKYLRRHCSIPFKAPTTSRDDPICFQSEAFSIVSPEECSGVAETLFFGSEEPSNDFIMCVMLAFGGSCCVDVSFPHETNFSSMLSHFPLRFHRQSTGFSH